MAVPSFGAGRSRIVVPPAREFLPESDIETLDPGDKTLNKFAVCVAVALQINLVSVGIRSEVVFGESAC